MPMLTSAAQAQLEKEKAKLRARRWQIAQVEASLCPHCANPAARLCKNKECRKYRKPVAHLQCTACDQTTEAMRLCMVHLARDRARKVAA